MNFSLRLLYLYLFSFVGLLIIVIGGIQLVDLGLKTYVFQVSDYTVYPTPAVVDPSGKVIQSTEEEIRQQKEEQVNQKKRQLSTALSMILIGTPLYLYHWKTIKKENT
jgi:hypothetical protein